MQGYKVKEKTAIVPHCTPSFKTQWAPWWLWCENWNRGRYWDGSSSFGIQLVGQTYQHH